MTYKLYEYQKRKFEEPGNEKLRTLFKDTEMPMIQIVGDMELIGVRVDLGYVQKLKEKYTKKLEEKNKELLEVYDSFKDLIEKWKTTANAQRNDLIEPKNSDLKKDDYEQKFDITNDIKGVRNKLGKKKLSQLSDPIKLSSSKQLAIFFYDVIGATSLKGKSPRGTGKEQIETLVEHFEEAIKIFTEIKKHPEATEDEEEAKTIRCLYKLLRKNVKINFEYNEIEGIIHRLEKAIQFCNLLKEQREFSKLITTYLNSMPKLSKHWPDGKIRFHLNPYGADTGRFSSGGGWKFLNDEDEPSNLSGMNQQNLPSRNHEIRLAFCADEGRAFVSGDFGSQEPKITGYMAQDKEMLKAFRDKKDIYAIISASAFQNKYEDNLEWYPEGFVTEDGHICGKNDRINEEGKERRKIGKTIFLAICYGMGASSLAKKLKEQDKREEKRHPEKVKEHEGKDYEGLAETMLENVFNTFSGAKKAIEDSKKMCKRFGYVEGLQGRRRRLPDINLPHYQAYIYNKRRLKGSEDIYIKTYLSRIEATGKDFLTSLELEKLNEEAINNNVIVFSNESKVRRAERQCFNAIVQGSAATMTKRTMIMVYKDPFLNQLDAHLVFQIHDELMVECPINNASKVEKRLQYLMEHSVDNLEIDIPMFCDMVVETRWGQKEMATELKGEYQTISNKGSKEPLKELCEEYSNFPQSSIEKAVNGEEVNLEFPISDPIEEESNASNENLNNSNEKETAPKKTVNKAKKSKQKPKSNRTDVSYKAIVNDILNNENGTITFIFNDEEHTCKIEEGYLIIESIRLNGKKSYYRIPLTSDVNSEKQDELIKAVLNISKLRAAEDWSKTHKISQKRAEEKIKKAIENGEIIVELDEETSSEESDN